jgi:hypothetical protein
MKMRKPLLVLSFLATAACVCLIGCDDLTVLRREPAGVKQETRSVSCNYSGYCLGYNGKFGFNYDCSGSRKAIVNVQSFVVRYKSGRIGMDEEVSVVRYLTDCQ